MSQRDDDEVRRAGDIPAGSDEPWGAQADRTAQTCEAAQRAAARAFRECLAIGGERARLELVRLLVDVEDVSQHTARLLTRRSELAVRQAGLCAEICQRTAEVCAVFQDDPALQACAEACRSCADVCRTLYSDAALIAYDEIVEESFPASDPPPGPGTRSRK